MEKSTEGQTSDAMLKYLIEHLANGGEQSIRPIPDPTRLTTEATEKLEFMLRNLIKVELEHSKELTDSSLQNIQLQFTMLEARTAEQKQDVKAALDAALAAQKEAVASQTASSEKSITKSETATTERIKGVEQLLANGARATDDKISDLKERIIAIEAIRLGGSVERSEHMAIRTDSRAGHDSLIALMVGVGIVVVPIIVFLASHFH